MKKHLLSLVVLCTAQCATGADGADATKGPSAIALRKAPAWAASRPEATMILGAGRAGGRLVGVGARGMVLLSDDEGGSWRQARQVPVRTTLTAVHFANPRAGWAVGHNGTILATSDGGETWTLQRFDEGADQPLFSVAFLDARRGIAVGLWSLILVTADAGATWRTVTLPGPPGGGKADRNLLKVFADPTGALYVAAERGTVLRSADGGATWSYHETGYTGSFWAGTVAPNGDVMVGGLRGNMYRSRDQGQSWQKVDTGTKSSLTDIVSAGDEVVAVGLDGAIVKSTDQGATFRSTQRGDRAPLTALVPRSDGQWVLFSKQGLLNP